MLKNCERVLVGKRVFELFILLTHCVFVLYYMIFNSQYLAINSDSTRIIDAILIFRNVSDE